MELGARDVAFLSRVTGGRLWALLEQVVTTHGEDVCVDLQLQIERGEATIIVFTVRGERLLAENTVCLGPVLKLPERARVIVECWRLDQDRRARARWVERTNRKLVALGLRPLDGSR